MSVFNRCTNKRHIFIVALAKTVLICITFISLGCVAIKYFCTFFFLQESSFCTVYNVKQECGQTNYADVSNYYDLQTNLGDNINSMVFMDATYDADCSVFRDINTLLWLSPLEQSQVAVSRSASSEYHLDIGSVICAELPYSHTIKEYTVAAIIDDYFVLDGFNRPQKLIVMGRDDAFYGYANGLEFIAFVDEAHRDEIASNALLITDAIDKQYYASIILLFGIVFLTLSCCIGLMIYALFYLFVESRIRESYDVVYRYGVTKKTLMRLLIVHTLLIIALPLSLGTMGTVLHSIKYNFKEITCIFCFLAVFTIAVSILYFLFIKEKTLKWGKTKWN